MAYTTNPGQEEGREVAMNYGWAHDFMFNYLPSGD